MSAASLLRRYGVAALVLACAGVAAGGAAHAPAPLGGVIVRATAASPSGTVQDAEDGAIALHLTTSAAAGYTFLQPRLTAETPTGFGVWVDPHAAHRWAIAQSASAAASDLRSYGIVVRWRGYGSPAAGDGVVRVREGSKGCGTDGSTVGVTWGYWKTLASGARYIYRSDVYLCPKLFRMGTWATRATVRHELGHAMGLGHTNYRYLGSYQVMNAVVRSGVTSYRSGDRRGFQTLAANTRGIKLQIPPLGSLDDSSWQPDNTIRFTGWALLQYYHSTPVVITLTDNGQVIYTGGTPLLRTDVNRAHDAGLRTHGFQFSTPWAGGTHAYCVSARSATHPAATTKLGCVTWRS